MGQEPEDRGASASPTALSSPSAIEPASLSRPSGLQSAGAWPAGPYRFDDISSPRQDDGLGYVYLADGGYSPTLAHTGDMGLSAAENRGLGYLFAAAPDLAATVDTALEFAVMFLAFVGRDQGTDRLDRTLDDLSAMAVKLDAKARAALARARGGVLT